MHCGAEVTESSTNKQHHLSAAKKNLELLYYYWSVFSLLNRSRFKGNKNPDRSATVTISFFE